MAAFDQFQNDGATCFFYRQLNVQRQIAHPVPINFVRTLRAPGRVAVVVGIFIFDDRRIPRRPDRCFDSESTTSAAAYFRR